jgi:RNA polymerase sigma factor (sigma-70 family)
LELQHPTLADTELIERAQRGDLEAYGELVKRHQDHAVAAAYVILGDRQEAEDAAQEALTRAFLALKRFRPGGSFRAWLFRIVVNEAHDLFAQRQRRSDLLARVGHLDGATPTPSAEAVALVQQRREALIEALFALPEVDRLVITCRYFLDLSEAEMAAVLGVARGTVKSRLARALARLQPILREMGPLALAAPVVEEVLHEAGRTALVKTSPALSQAVVQQVSVALPMPPPLVRLWHSIQSNVGAIAAGATAVVAAGAVGVFLLAPTRQAVAPAPVAAVPSPSPAAVDVYGGDITDADRQELATYFGTPQPAGVQTISQQELVQSLQAQGIPVAPGDQAISSVRLTCGAPRAGLEIQTRNITRLSAAAYAGMALTAGFGDGVLQIGAPSSKPVSGEAALVGMLKAYPTCAGSRVADPARVQLAYQQLKAIESVGGTDSDLKAASSMVLQVQQGMVAGGAADPQKLQQLLDGAAAQHQITLDDTVRSQLSSLFQQLEAVDFGEYGHGFRVDESGRDHVKIESAQGN